MIHTHRTSSDPLPIVERGNNVFDDGRRFAVPGLSRAEGFGEWEVARGAGGEDFVAGRDGELDGV